MQNVRAVFSKENRAKYISHLDLMRVFMRAFARSKLPVWFTEGYTPHIYLTFALPLQLGVESAVETVDFRLLEPVPEAETVGRLNAALPEDIRVLGLREPADKPDAIAFADYTLRFGACDLERIAGGYAGFLAAPSAPVLKKSKSGEREIDLKTFFSPLSQEQTEAEFIAKVRLAAGPQNNVNPSLLLAALQPWLPPEDDCALGVRRTAILRADLTPFC